MLKSSAASIKHTAKQTSGSWIHVNGEMKRKFRVQFFYSPLQFLSKSHALIDFRKDIKNVDVKAGDVIWSNFNLQQITPTLSPGIIWSGNS